MERGNDPDLQTLMTRLADGDRSAFHPAFEVLWPILRRFLLLGFVAPLPRVGRMIPFVVACSVATLMGAVGCLLYGLVGLVIMASGMATGTTGLVVIRRT